MDVGSSGGGQMTTDIKFQDGGVIRDFEIPKPTMYVAVYYYPNSDQPFGCTGTNREELIRAMTHWSGLDRSHPVRIYTIVL